MYGVSNLFEDYTSELSREFEIKAIINNVTYDNTAIVEFSPDESCVTGDEFTLGTVVTNSFTLSIITSNTIAANSMVKPFVRMNGDEGYTEWVPLGVYYIDSRIEKNGVWTFTCYDRLIYAEQEYVSSLTFPTSMQNVFNEIIGQLSLIADTSVVIDPLYEIQYKPDGLYTIRKMLGFIASANAASVGLTKDGKIRFIKFTGSPVAITASDYITCQQTNPVKTYTKIILTYNSDGETLEAGTGDADHTLNLYNPFINETMLGNLLTAINGLSYAPISMEWKGLPQIEVGDPIQITLRDSSELNTFVLTNKSRYKGGLSSTINAPSISSQKSEFKYEGSLSKEIATKVQKDTPYYGVTIGRTYGLKIETSDGHATAIFNSDKLSMQVDGEDMVYFDPVSGKFKFNGTLEAADGVFSGTISFNQITGMPNIPSNSDITTITANYISTPNLYTQIGTVYDTLHLGSADTRGYLIFETGANIFTEDSPQGPWMHFVADELVFEGDSFFDQYVYFSGNVDFTGATIAGLNVIAKLG